VNFKLMQLLNYKVFLPENPKHAEDKTPLFILHGLLGSMDNWRSQAKRLSQTRPVYTLDLRNHGGSPHIKGMSYREMYEDVINVTKHERINQFHLLGHSMGGKVAMQLALAQAAMVKSLIIVDIAPKPYPLWHQKTLQGVLSVPDTAMQSRQDANEYLKDWIEDDAERSFMLKNLKKNTKPKEGFSWRCDLHEISRGYLKIAGFSATQQQYSKPTLFIRGENSAYIQDADLPLIRRIFSDVEIFTINDSGHLPHFQQPEQFSKKVESFLEKSSG